VFAVNPVTVADTATETVPDPAAGVHGALDPYATLVPYSNTHAETCTPFGFTVAFNVAELSPADPDPVTTVGDGSVVLNDWSEPTLAPPAFVAETRKWYVVFAVRPVTAADTATGLTPDPGAGAHGALDPYDVVVPYSSLHSVTSPPFGLTVALSVAVVDPTDDAASVTTVGALGSVLNVWSEPLLVPPALVAETRKW
jgi:hypothetical protein